MVQNITDIRFIKYIHGKGIGVTPVVISTKKILLGCFTYKEKKQSVYGQM